MCEGLRCLLQNIIEWTASCRPKNLPDRSRLKLWRSIKQTLFIKNVSYVLNISQSIIKFIFRKWRVYDTIANLPRQDHSLKLTGWAKRALIRVAIKRSMVTLEVLQRSTAQVWESVHRITIISCTLQIWPLWKSGKKKAIAEKKPNDISFAVYHKPRGRYSKHIEEIDLVKWKQNWTIGS